MEEQEDVADQPDGDGDGLDDQELPRADARRDLVRQHLAERGLVVVELVDWMPVQVSPRFASAQSVLQLSVGRVARTHFAATLAFWPRGVQVQRRYCAGRRPQVYL